MLSYLFYKIIRSDLESYTIPDRYSLFIGVSGLVLVLARSLFPVDPGAVGNTVWDHVVLFSHPIVTGQNAIIVGDIMSRVILSEIIFIISGLVCGMGDAKLFAALALLIGARVWFVFFASFALCGTYCGISLIARRLRMGDHIAFAPFISSAALAIIITSAMPLHAPAFL